MTAASAGEPPPAGVYEVKTTAPLGGASERTPLTQFAEYGRLEADPAQGPLAGSLASLASLTPDGDGDGLRLYSDTLVPAYECTFGEVRNR